MTVWKRGKKWRAEVWHKGKRIWGEKFNTEAEARLAETEERESLTEINTDFMKLCESRLNELEIKRSKSHFKENHTLIKNLIKKWGNKSRVSRDEIEQYLNEIARESMSKANKQLRLIKALFEHGVKRGWLRFNPTRGIERYPETPRKRYVPPEGDIKKVLELANPEQRRYLLVVAHTLGRVRAVNNLKWEDVHEDHLCLYTRKARNSDLKEIRVPMNDVLKEVMACISRQSEFVFPNPQTGRPYDYRDKFLPRLCRLAQVKPFMYHALRHFGASKLDNLGVPLTDIQELLGHERATTTDTYLRSLRGSTKEAVKKLEDLQ